MAASGEAGAPSAQERLRRLGLTLPEARPPSGSYVAAVRTGDLLYVSGQGSSGHVGRLGADMTIEEGRVAAQTCALKLLAHARASLESLDRIDRVVKIVGFVACTDDFVDAPAVVDAASELLVDVLGERGRHARSALGIRTLPLGLAVEIEMVVSVRDA